MSDRSATFPPVTINLRPPSHLPPFPRRIYTTILHVLHIIQLFFFLV